jgi:hypothetical protein
LEVRKLRDMKKNMVAIPITADEEEEEEDEAVSEATTEDSEFDSSGGVSIEDWESRIVSGTTTQESQRDSPGDSDTEDSGNGHSDLERSPDSEVLSEQQHSAIHHKQKYDEVRFQLCVTERD